MESRFQLLNMETSLKKRSIHLIFSLDIDEDSVVDNIYLMKISPRAVVPCSLVTDGRSIDVQLQEWPVPNTDYSLVVEPGKILSITGDVLENFLPITLTFKSEVTSDVKILSPSNFDTVDGELSVTWQEIGNQPTQHYYLEAATDKTFNDLIVHEKIDKSAESNAKNCYSATLPELKEAGQYYLRIRSEDDNGYGSWSDIVTVVIPKEKTVVPNPQPEEKPRPELPEIVDYTKMESGTVEPGTVTEKQTLLTPKQVAINDALPESFEIHFANTISMDEHTVVKVERRTI